MCLKYFLSKTHVGPIESREKIYHRVWQVRVITVVCDTVYHNSSLNLIDCVTRIIFFHMGLSNNYGFKIHFEFQGIFQNI